MNASSTCNLEVVLLVQEWKKREQDCEEPMSKLLQVPMELQQEFQKFTKKRSSAYSVFLHRQLKLRVFRKIVYFTRVNDEQIGVWRWKLRTEDLKMYQQKKLLKRCNHIALKCKAHSYFRLWQTRPKLSQCLSDRPTISSMSTNVPDFALREVFMKTRIRWFYSFREKFIQFRHSCFGTLRKTPISLHLLLDKSRGRLSNLTKRMQSVQKQRSRHD
mmetsp:Transcript_21859/g.39855  ORF Transcript_21859/g.39855 Transcript_21859/m.39855 type:complete len:216 (-) Transcript_21859:1217-1864(-)